MTRAVLVAVLLVMLPSCTAVVVWRRNVPSLGERLPPITVTVPQDRQHPVVVKED